MGEMKRLMGMVIFRRGMLALALGLASVAVAQQGSWVVKPEWVRAHEEVLASDALGGRGSATPMEEITANYVAAEFIGYGLKMAPGMTSYIQSADVEPFAMPNGRQRMRLADAPSEKSRKTFNAIGYLEGTDPSAGTILLSAHLDHLGIRGDGPDQIYNGADDREPGPEDAEGRPAVDGLGAVEPWADAEGTWSAAGAGSLSGAEVFSAV